MQQEDRTTLTREEALLKGLSKTVRMGEVDTQCLQREGGGVNDDVLDGSQATRTEEVHGGDHRSGELGRLRAEQADLRSRPSQDHVPLRHGVASHRRVLPRGKLPVQEGSVPREWRCN